MASLGFTGTRNISDVQAKDLVQYFESPGMQKFFGYFHMFVTGGCNGFDALIGRHLATELPLADHVVVVPWNTSQVDDWWDEPGFEHVRVVLMPEGTDYKDRNTKIVELSTQLFYCADYPEKHGKSLRSGTWQTVRIAKRADHYVSGIILNN